MRTPDQDELPGDGDSTPTIGAGFGGVSPEELSPYGDDFYDEYDDNYDGESSSSDDDGSFGDEDTDADTTIEDGDFPTGEVTEEEAEDILEDVLEEGYGDNADEVVQDLQEDSGMSALEILEDLTGLDLDGSDDASYAADFDRAMAEAAEANAVSSPTTSDLFNEDMPSESDFDLDGDHDVDRDDLDEAIDH